LSFEISQAISIGLSLTIRNKEEILGFCLAERIKAVSEESFSIESDLPINKILKN